MNSQLFPGRSLGTCPGYQSLNWDKVKLLLSPSCDILVLGSENPQYTHRSGLGLKKEYVRETNPTGSAQESVS